MINYDKIKMYIPTSCFENVDIDGSHETISYFPNGDDLLESICCTFNRYSLPAGVNSMKYLPGRGIHIEFTAKVLGEEYFRLINRETIGLAIKNALGNRMTYNLDLVMNESEVYLVHVTEDIKCCCPVTEVLSTLGMIRHPDYFTNGYDTSVVFKHRVKQDSRRLICYDKHKEMKSHRSFLKNNGGKALLDKFSNVLRMEMQITKKNWLKRYFGQIDGRITLRMVLNSRINPLTETFKEITAYLGKDPVPVEMPSTIGAIEKHKGRLAIIEENDCDYNKVRYYVNSHNKGNNSRILYKYKKMIQELSRVRVYTDYGRGHVQSILDALPAAQCENVRKY